MKGGVIKMEVLNVIYQTAAGQGTAFYQALKAEGIDTATQKENGSICYEFFQSMESQDKILLLEISCACFLRHFGDRRLLCCARAW